MMNAARFYSTLAFAALCFLAACGGRDTESGVAPGTPSARTSVAASPPTVDVTRTAATSTPGACGLKAALCSFAKQIEQAAATRGADSLMELARPQTFACPGNTGEPLSGPFPLCDGASAGEERHGFAVVGLQSEGSVQSAEMVRDFLQRWVDEASVSATDEYGDGAVRLASIGCPKRDAAIDCTSYVVVLTRLTDNGARGLLLLTVNGAAPHVVTAFGRGAASLNGVMLTGGESPTRIPGSDERVPAFYTAVAR